MIGQTTLIPNRALYIQGKVTTGNMRKSVSSLKKNNVLLKFFQKDEFVLNSATQTMPLFTFVHGKIYTTTETKIRPG